MLYHASPVKGLTLIKPGSLTQREEGDPPRVYASPDRGVASPFMLRFGGWLYYGSTDGEVWELHCLDEARFWNEEKLGGSIYTVSDHTFASDGQHLGEYEWYSASAVVPFYEEQWDSVFSALLHYKIRLYFFTQEEYYYWEALSLLEREAVIAATKRREDGTYKVSFERHLI